MAQPLPTHLPLRNRRRGRRVLTLKNFWLALLAVVVIFAGLTLVANRGKSTPGEYGTLYGAQQPAVNKTEFHPAIVTEAPPPVPEQERADPLLLDAAVKAQYLGTGPATGSAAPGSSNLPGSQAATTSSATSVDNSSFGPSPANAPLRHGQKVSIVGDSDGIAVVKQ
jgi:hypothetical protein